MNIWPFLPQRNYTESLEWFSDVIRCPSSEERTQLRNNSRAYYHFSYFLDEHLFSLAKSIARNASSGPVLLPLWGELTNLPPISSGVSEVAFDTAYAQYTTGAQIIIWDSPEHWEVCEIATVEVGRITFSPALEKSYTAPLIAPIQEVFFSSPLKATRGAHSITRVEVAFVAQRSYLPSGNSSLPEYRGRPVVIERSFLSSSSMEEEHQRETRIIDYKIGTLFIDPAYTYPTQSFAYTWDVDTREAYWSLISWLNWCRGRVGSFWVPSWNADLTVVMPIFADDMQIVVQSVSYAELETVKDIMILTKDGSYYFARILNGTPGSIGEEILALEAPIGVKLEVENINFVCYLSPMRLNSDRVELHHHAARRVTAQVRLFETPLEV